MIIPLVNECHKAHKHSMHVTRDCQDGGAGHGGEAEERRDLAVRRQLHVVH